MSTVEARRETDGYLLSRTPQEYERLRVQSRGWEAATGRLLDRVGLAAGASCLDAGCGPGETMRLMAERVGPSGRVTGIDVDSRLSAQAQEALHEAGHRQCRFVAFDATSDERIPGGPFDLVYARLLIIHMPDRVAVLRRLWDAVAPGGHLLIQDYDFRGLAVLPALDSVDELIRVIVAAASTSGRDVHTGTRLPELFARAGIGAPDGTDVAGRLEPLAEARGLFTVAYTSMLATAIAHGITSKPRASALLTEVARDADRFPDRSALWPLLVGAWKRKAPCARALCSGLAVARNPSI